MTVAQQYDAYMDMVAEQCGLGYDLAAANEIATVVMGYSV